jgi:hypothetical protein
MFHLPNSALETPLKNEGPSHDVIENKGRRSGSAPLSHDLIEK